MIIKSQQTKFELIVRDVQKRKKKTLQFLWQEKTKSPREYQHTISTTLQHNEAKTKTFASFNVTRLLFIPNDAFRRSAG